MGWLCIKVAIIEELICEEVTVIEYVEGGFAVHRMYGGVCQ